MSSDANITAEEAMLCNLLGKVWNGFLELPEQHPSDRYDFCKAIHTAQDLLLARTGYRQLKIMEQSQGE